MSKFSRRIKRASRILTEREMDPAYLARLDYFSQVTRYFGGTDFDRQEATRRLAAATPTPIDRVRFVNVLKKRSDLGLTPESEASRRAADDIRRRYERFREHKARQREHFEEIYSAKPDLGD